MSSTILTGGRTSGAQGSSAPAAAWKSVAWFGGALTFIGVAQLALYFFPSLGFGSPEWEYGASAQLLGALPLPTIGIAALLAAALALGSRWLRVSVAVLLIMLALLSFATLTLFWSVAPMALRATAGAVSGPVQQTVARTTLNGLGFGTLYLFMAWRALRQARP